MDSRATHDDRSQPHFAGTVDATLRKCLPAALTTYMLAWAPLLAVLLLGVIFVGAPGAVAAGSKLGAAPTSVPAEARALYERVLAPCCWTQTLDIHESASADELRREIVERLAKGESALSVEDDLARRFGERVRALPRGRDPRQAAAWFAFTAMAVSLLTLVFVARRWIARALAESGQADAAARLVSLTPEEESHLERELDRSLQRFDAKQG